MDQTYKQRRSRQYLEELKPMKARLSALRINTALSWEKATATTPRPTSEAAILGTTIDRTNNKSRADEKYAEDAEGLRHLTKELEAAYHERVITINKLSDHMAAAILMNKYVNEMTWEETAEVMGYSESHIKVKGNEALSKLYEVLPAYAK